MAFKNRPFEKLSPFSSAFFQAELDEEVRKWQSKAHNLNTENLKLQVKVTELETLLKDKEDELKLNTAQYTAAITELQKDKEYWQLEAGGAYAAYRRTRDELDSLQSKQRAMMTPYKFMWPVDPILGEAITKSRALGEKW